MPQNSPRIQKVTESILSRFQMTDTPHRRYISENPTVMNGIFDADGYWRTGDMGKLEGDLVYVFGRASQDSK